MTIKATPFVLPVLCALYSLTGETSYQTREPRGPLPSGGNFTAKPLPHDQPRAQRARSGVQGHCPLREPRGPSPSGGKTPANPHVSLRPLRGKAAQSGVQGYYPWLDDVVLFEELFDVGAGNLAHHRLEGQLLQ